MVNKSTGKQCPHRYIGMCLALLFLYGLVFIILRNPYLGYTTVTAESVDVTLSPEAEADYHRLINITFNFKRLPKACHDLESNFVVVVHSAPSNFEKRKTVRETWGSWYNKTKVLFAVGDTQDQQLSRRLQLEDEDHRDFLQGDFLDAYENLTYKHVMVLKYMVYHCPKAQYVLKVDDDALVNMPNFVDFVAQYEQRYSNSTNIICNCMRGAPVLRDGRWGVSRDVIPQDVYPDYCSGYSVVYTAQAAKKLYYEAQKTPYFWIDDVQVTGIVAKSAGVKHKCTEYLTLSETLQSDILKEKYKGELKPFIFGYFNIGPEDLRKLWRYVMERIPKTSIVDYIY